MMADERPETTQGASLIWSMRRKSAVGHGEKHLSGIRRKEGYMGECHLCFPSVSFSSLLRLHGCCLFKRGRKAAREKWGWAVTGLAETDIDRWEMCYGVKHEEINRA